MDVTGTPRFKKPSESAREALAARGIVPRPWEPAPEVKHRTPDPDRAATCQRCGRTFVPARSDAAYCGARCRQAAYRARLAAEKPKPRRRPLIDDFRGASLDLATMVRRWERLVGDDRFRRSRKDLRCYREDLVRARDALTAMIEAFD